MKRLSPEQFIKEANKIHNNFYDYSFVEYKNNKTKVKIICPIHGEFYTTPHNHLDKQSGCPKCRYDKVAKKLSLTIGKFIERANKVHNNKYNYSLVEYKNQNSIIKIICPIHGEFLQQAGIHLQGHGCPKCANEKNGLLKRLTQEEFIEKANKVHNNKYNYSLVNYETAFDNIKIICPVHG
ncbi:MAG: DUF723 domain-containing protein, partial [Elusimicrobiota bacterium]|nr:DUF723 domain-containing protein [Elusimicrobiota bacterium]